MPPPSYPYRHLLLTQLLDGREQDTPPDAFAVPGVTNERGCKLDTLLLSTWATSTRRAKALDHDALQHAENLRLKRNDFEVLGRIGEGQFGVVDAVRSKLDGKVYAMKTIEKSMAVRAGNQLGLPYERHIHTLATAGPSPAPQLAAAFQSPSSLHLVTTFASCGSLWDRLNEMLPQPGLDTGRMADEEVKWWARQMVDAISWLHGQNYAHRDIKPHNFLLLPEARLWLTDFGSAAPLTNGKVLRGYCQLPAGTPDYVAPEVLRLAEDAMVEAAQSADESIADTTIRQLDADLPGYSVDVDWWSLGATLYEMAAGRAPFWAPSIGGTYDRIMRCDLRMPDDLSPQLKSLLSGLLSPPDVRLGSNGVQEIRKTSFFNGVDWTKRGTPPPGVSPQQIDLGTLAESFVHDFDDFPEITFEHFFAASPGTSAASVSRRTIAPSVWERWVGWSWDPPADFFGAEPPDTSPVRLLAPPLPVRQNSAPAALFTPLKGHQRTPPTVPRTAPRSVPRTRPVSERQAFAELVRCVEASARKKIAMSKPPNSASSQSTSTSPLAWRKEQPPTPTPMSREVTALSRRTHSRTPSLTSLSLSGQARSQSNSRSGSISRAGSHEIVRQLEEVRSPAEPSSRGGTLSRGSMRSRDDTLLARLAALDQPTPRGVYSREDTVLARLAAVDGGSCSASASLSRSDKENDAERTVRPAPHAGDETVRPARPEPLSSRFGINSLRRRLDEEVAKRKEFKEKQSADERMDKWRMAIVDEGGQERPSGEENRPPREENRPPREENRPPREGNRPPSRHERDRGGAPLSLRPEYHTREDRSRDPTVVAGKSSRAAQDIDQLEARLDGMLQNLADLETRHREMTARFALRV